MRDYNKKKVSPTAEAAWEAYKAAGKGDVAFHAFLTAELAELARLRGELAAESPTRGSPWKGKHHEGSLLHARTPH